MYFIYFMYLLKGKIEGIILVIVIVLLSEEPNGNSLYTYLQNYCIKYHYVREEAIYLHYYLYYGVNHLIPNLVQNWVQNSIFNMSRWRGETHWPAGSRWWTFRPGTVWCCFTYQKQLTDSNQMACSVSSVYVNMQPQDKGSESCSVVLVEDSEGKYACLIYPFIKKYWDRSYYEVHITLIIWMFYGLYNVCLHKIILKSIKSAL